MSELNAQLEVNELEVKERRQEIKDLKKDVQTVRADGTLVRELIEGVEIRELRVQQDERGTTTEIYSERWDYFPDPIGHIVRVGIQPGKVKGWSKHINSTDRGSVIQGTVKVVLFDDRKNSSTNGMINELCFGPAHPAIFTIPNGVFHAVQNVGTDFALMLVMPTNPFDHEDPDKYRLSPDTTDYIPYRFNSKIGW